MNEEPFELTDEHRAAIIQLGVAAHEFLSSRVAMQAFQAVKSQLITNMLTTTPNEKEDRERLYFQLLNMDSLYAMLLGWHNQGQQLQQQLHGEPTDA
jgi:hypothetical protein